MANREVGVGIIVTYNQEQQGTLIPGEPSPAISNSLDRYDIFSQQWTPLSSMSERRCGHAMFLYDEKIYAIGGTDGLKVHNSLEEYDIYTDAWQLKSPIPQGFCFAQTCESDGYIYVIGGLTANEFGETSATNKVYKYSILSDEWTELADLPEGYSVMMGICHFVDNYIYILSGYINEVGTYLDRVLVYSVADDTWEIEDTLTTIELNLFRRILPFTFLEDGYIYVVNGLYFVQIEPITDPDTGEITQNFDPLIQYLPDAYRYNISTGDIERSENHFVELPRARYSGATVSAGYDHYFIGGINESSNTLKFIEKINSLNDPFSYEDFDRMIKGRSSFGAISYLGEYNDGIYISGGTSSYTTENFLQINLEAVPAKVKLDGQQTCQVRVSAADENSEYPDSVLIRLSAKNGDEDRFIFTNDTISVINGFGLATLIPRAADFPDNYSINISGTVIDENYVGYNNIQTSQEGGPTSPVIIPGGIINESDVDLPGIYGNPIIYTTVIAASQITSGHFLNTSDIQEFVSVKTNYSNNSSNTSVGYYNNQKWLPQVFPIIDSNEGDFETLQSSIDRLAKEKPWGGSPIYDAISYGTSVMKLSENDDKKVTFVLSDGEDLESHYSPQETITQNSEINNTASPIVSSILRIIPESLYLDQGTRDSAAGLEIISKESGGSFNYVISTNDLDSTIKRIISSTGFLGYGVFVFEVDLGEESLIESLYAGFNIQDNETYGRWKYSLANDDKKYSIPTELIEPNSFARPSQTFGRFIKIIVEFTASLGTDVYNASEITPPQLVEFEIIYHKKSEAVIFFTPKETDEAASQIMITIDCTRPFGSEILLAATDYESQTWENYESPASPSVENSTRIVFPIRKTLNTSSYMLEPLKSIDGFIFETTYGKWSPDADVIIYKNGDEVVNSDEYYLVPNKGKIVFSYFTEEDYLISISNKNTIAVSAKIINRVHGDPVLITGSGYMYSTLAQKNLSSNRSAAIPQAQNVLIIPLQPDVNSVLRLNYEYSDVSGRSEIQPITDPSNVLFSQCTQISWFVNNILQPELQNFTSWDNKIYELVKSGDELYAVVHPAASTKVDQSTIGVFGIKTRSLPVVIA